MQSISCTDPIRQRAEELWGANLALGKECDRQLEAAYLRAEETARQAFQTFLDLHDPAPEWCGRCGKNYPLDAYLERHAHHWAA